MKAALITICLALFSLMVNAQQNYDVSLIPKELLPYACAVIRNDELHIEVKDLDNTYYSVKRAITVLNKNGDDIAHMAIEHDKINIIKSVKGAVYNEFGKLINKFSESDFEDVSAYDGFSLFNDDRVKHYLPAITEYPYTLVYEYETRSKQSLNFEEWRPNVTPGVAVEKSVFTFSCKPDFNIRYKETRLPATAVISVDAHGLKTYSWMAGNLKAVKDEPFSPYFKSFTSSVKIAPETFTYYGFKGSFANWSDLGKWQYNSLVANRQELSLETIEHIKEITKDIPDPKLKAKKIYEYMQQKTHYVSVQVGIGGYQPFLAADVDKQNYGDCKALVNYTQALLKAVNIDSYYCVVEAGRDYKVGLMNDFASMDQGNHIILCLPFKNDTTWADCTSQTIPFGYLGDFTDDRNVLACTPHGGKLMHTPKYNASNNLVSHKGNFAINEAGELSGSMLATFKGTNYDERENLITEPKQEQYKTLQRIYPINNMDIESVEFKQDKSYDPVTTEDLKFHARDYASIADGKLNFAVNPIRRASPPPRQVRNRLTDVYINRGYTKNDEVIYTLPVGYHFEKMPLNVSVNKPFAQFKASIELHGNQLIYKRSFQLKDGTYSKDTYQDLVDFYQLVYEADGYNVVLGKTAG